MKFSRKTFVSFFFLLFLGFFIFLVVLEIYLRLRGYRSPSYAMVDKKTNLVVHKPGIYEYVYPPVNPCLKNRLRINNLGFHSCKDYFHNKPSGVYRIVVLGDSYVEAVQVPCDKTFHYILEEKLNSYFNGKFEVLNFGVGGGGRLSSLLYLIEYAEQFKPDMIIDLFVYNDIRDDDIFFLKNLIYPDLSKEDLLSMFRSGDYEIIKHILAKARGYGAIGPWRERIKFYIKIKFLNESASLRFIHTLYSRYKTRLLWKRAGDVSVYEDFGHLKVRYDDYTEWLWEWQKELIKKIVEYSKELGARYVLVSATEGYTVHDSLMKQTPIYNNPEYDIYKKEKILERISEELGLEYIPLLYDFRKRAEFTDEMTVFECDGHWNEVGHRWAAEIIFEKIKDKIIR